ncbi:Fc.00g038390.m01.CDS01 [Cosmosporella sp. VM-42]
MPGITLAPPKSNINPSTAPFPSHKEPCSSCITANQVCEYRERDEKRRPCSHEYVLGLEYRIAWLESLVMQGKASLPEDRDASLQSVSFNDHLAARTQQSDSGWSTLTDSNIGRPQADLRLGPEERDNPGSPSLSYLGLDSNFEHVLRHFDIDIQDEVITDVLMLFFNPKHWSSALLLAICALGTLMRPDLERREMSERFFAAAESIILASGLTHPSITTVQAFLCLPFYEIGRGNLSKGWGYSRIAFRMAQDLGFQRDPKHWLSYDSNLAAPEDFEIRRRIYWGCYSSDKLVSIILGRPVYFFEEDAEVDLMERLPDFAEMEPWLAAGTTERDILATGGLFHTYRDLIRILRMIETMLTKLFSPTTNLTAAGRRACVEGLNLDLYRWQASLSGTSQWNRWESASAPLVPSVAALHELFHSVRIAINFDSATSPDLDMNTGTFRTTCLSAAQDIISLVRRYRVQFGLKHAPISFVYAILQAARATKSLGIPQESQYLMQTLEKCSVTWELARQAWQQMAA